jgi:two-component sensor histidine kinase
MKTRKTLFLFCLFIICSFQYISSQVNQDSVDYYDRIINKETPDASNLIKAYIHFDREKTWYLKEGNLVWAVYFLDKMSVIEKQLGRFYDSEKTAVEGLKLLDQLPMNSYNNGLRYRLMNRIGMIHWKYRDYKESFKYHSKLLEVVESKSDSATIYNNIGISYKYQEKYDSARFFLQKAYNLSKQLKKKHPILAKSLDNLGFVQGMLNIEEGLPNMKKALEIRKSESEDIYESYKHLTEFYRLKGDEKQALYYAQNAYDLSVAEKADRYQLESLQNLLELEMHNYVDEYLALARKISLEDQINDNKFAKAKYDYSQAELKAEKEKSRRIIYQIIAFFIILLLICTVWVMRIHHRKRIAIRQFETEQQISKKLHDEVANDMFHTMNKVKQDKMHQSELLDSLDGMYHKVRDISKANSDLDVKKDFGRLLKDLFTSYETEDTNIMTIHLSNMDWTHVSEIKRKTLYRVLQELMVNMKKHSKATLVTLNFQKNKQKTIVSYIDNGIGCLLEKGSGLTNTESRMEMVGGKITFESEPTKGFRVNLIL